MSAIVCVNNPEARALSPDVVLPTGRIVGHSYLPNGAQAADIIGGGEMTSPEWEAYCAAVRARLVKKIVAVKS